MNEPGQTSGAAAVQYSDMLALAWGALPTFVWKPGSDIIPKCALCNGRKYDS